MDRRVAARSTRGRPWCLALGLACTLAGSAPARAQESFLLPLEAAAPLALGTAWDRGEARPIGDPGACMGGAGAERHEGGPTTWTLVVLSRAGGRLLVGAHVARTIASEGLAEARIPDAARRLAQGEGADFRLLCGDGFVAARALGGQYVGEIEIGPGQARAASARLRTGVWTEPGPFQAGLEALARATGAQARELPGGRRSEAVPIAPDELARRALAFPDTVTAETAAPFLAMVRSYPEWAFAGTTIAIDPTLGWGDAARAVFLHDAAAGGSAAAARSAEMRKAVVKRRPGDPRRPFGIPAGAAFAGRAVEPGSAAEAGLAGGAEPAANPSAPAAAPAAPPAPAPAVEALPASVAATAAEPPPPVAQRRRMAALVYAGPEGGTPVFATTQAPPGVYAEKVKQRVYWVPGVAAPTDAVREALARAAAAPPARGTTIVVAEVAGTAVVLTDVAPAPGIHAEPAGALQAWIAGVTAPTPAQREALAAAARGGD
ncbi:MAG: hypothetical protein OZ948_01950 [Deltaproteobacteria bacterium]|nr:hypothetical protein [Deltaproteobacteria bacterium]